METRVQELENTRKQMEEELSSEKSDKEVFKEEMERLRRVCDQLDEDLRNRQESFEKISEENKELVKKMSDYNKNNVFNEHMRFISRPREIEVVDKIANDPLSLHIPRIEDAEIELKTQLLKNDAISAELLEETRKDLARVTKEREDFKQKYEELEKQLEDTLASLERQRSASLHDRATSPGEPIQFEFEENFQCSRCDALEEECSLLRTEKDFIKGKREIFEEEVKKLNREIKELGVDHLREKQTLQKEIQNMKEEHENLSRDFEKELQKMLCHVNEQQLVEMKNLQGQNDELNDQINKHKSEVQKITAQLKKEKSQLEKNQEDVFKMKKNLAREKRKLKESKEELASEGKAKTDAWKELAKLKIEVNDQENQRREEIARVCKDFEERCKCEALREEIERLRSMSGRVLNYRKDFDRHGVIYALGTNFSTSPW
ncbi:hypothetical protein OS493_022016 [Desmophyllum pertusum]|uniref:Uncharacterized protein n=1 Tax=Desmophyllum pertusum TaxID=174260 RepID=A0A9W9Z2B6_9CNID|nr:hypothetical protein OS493_022016 [Desmophyllum pertusum]